MGLQCCVPQVLRHKTVCVKQLSDGKEMIPFVPHDSVVRWTRKNTVRKLQVSWCALSSRLSVCLSSSLAGWVAARWEEGLLYIV